MRKIIVTSFLILVLNIFYSQFEKLKSNVDYTVDNCTGDIYIYGESETGTFEVVKLNEDLKVLSSNTFDINIKKHSPFIVSNGLSTQIVLTGKSKTETISLDSKLKIIKKIDFEVSKDGYYRHIFTYPTCSKHDTIVGLFYNQTINSSLLMNSISQPLDSPYAKEYHLFYDQGVNKQYSKETTLSLFKKTDSDITKINDFNVNIKSIAQSIVAPNNNNEIIIAAIDTTTLFIRSINIIDGTETYSRDILLSSFGITTPYSKISYNKFINTFTLINLSEQKYNKDSIEFTTNIVSVDFSDKYNVSNASFNNVMPVGKKEKSAGISSINLRIKNTKTGTYASHILNLTVKTSQGSFNADNSFSSSSGWEENFKILNLHKITTENITSQEFTKEYLDELDFIKNNNIKTKYINNSDYIIDNGSFNFIFRQNYNPLNRTENDPLLLYNIEKNKTYNELDWSLRNKNDVYPFTAASSPFIRSKIYQTNNEKSIIIFHAVDGPFKKIKFEIEIKELK